MELTTEKEWNLFWEEVGGKAPFEFINGRLLAEVKRDKSGKFLSGIPIKLEFEERISTSKDDLNRFHTASTS